ncbi:hypothetical protein HMPREF1863_00914 [Aedoeadaptatus coxii]|uniref:Uncharacterized protein n=1 Tax=Aedoeadaptatus coxii TaxID=755172 RepID=A0A134AGL9_9FIRM|nr:hypothetical protein HMPREF1863_00914 [Peptoniphilus coxii]
MLLKVKAEGNLCIKTIVNEIQSRRINREKVGLLKLRIQIEKHSDIIVINNESIKERTIGRRKRKI